MTPRRENNLSSVPPSNSLARLCLAPLKGFFDLTRHPSRALASPLALLLELQRYKDTVRYVALGADAPGQHQKQLMQTQIMRLLKTLVLQ